MGRAFEYRKNRKMKRWGAMSKMFSKIGREIVVAVKSGGADPDSNNRLRALMQNAKAANMPKDNVERAIKRATSKDQEDYKEIVYEGYAPHGIAIVVETTTDNINRTVAAVRSIFTRGGGTLGTTGSLEFMFEKKCVFRVKPREDISVEDLELELIDFGADDVFLDDMEVAIYATWTEYGAIQKHLEELKFEIISSDFERIPTDTKHITEEQMVDIDKMLDKFDEDEDVTNVYTNMA